MHIWGAEQRNYKTKNEIRKVSERLWAGKVVILDGNKGYPARTNRGILHFETRSGKRSGLPKLRIIYQKWPLFTVTSTRQIHFSVHIFESKNGFASVVVANYCDWKTFQKWITVLNLNQKCVYFHENNANLCPKWGIMLKNHQSPGFVWQ